jgi:phosphonate ABC transporter permease subunit PhnE
MGRRPSGLAKPNNGKRSLWVGVAIIAGVLIYAYGFEQTEVDLSRIRAEDRQARLVNIVRALARPDLVEYDLAETVTELEFRIPCSANGEPPATPNEDRFIQATPSCAEPRAEILLEGFGFPANQTVRLALVPTSQVELRLGDARTDSNGNFALEARLPNRPAEEPQLILARTTEPSGSPRLTQTATDTFDKIIETVFLALIATTFAIALAIPLSFFAARNLMKDITSPLANVAIGIIALPLGAAAGILIARLASNLSSSVASNTLFAAGSLVVVPYVSWWLLRQVVPSEDEGRRGGVMRWVRQGLIIGLAALAGIIALYLAADLLQLAGDWLASRLGPFAFLGSFLSTLGELLEFGTVVIAAVGGAGALVVVGNRFGHAIRKRLPTPTLQLLNVPLSMAAGAVVTLLIARVIGWFYQWTDTPRTLWIPMGVGALLGLLIAARSFRADNVKVGLATYYLTRTIFNVLRAIEPLIMAIVFVVWVGLGPFAGALALALHTIAALAKLYSEQVESIAPGPLEAIRATGATRLQTVVYGVVPQVIPPYISFTMYRWDINVRMSTIIGFVGGGGIGFLLQQNINLLNYRGAAAQILAIAIVVAAMDALSSRIRERYV